MKSKNMDSVKDEIINQILVLKKYPHIKSKITIQKLQQKLNNLDAKSSTKSN
tara:strand:- start:570 stop:725 length:156 start_codon:yes stop_codon:yes gene_type:complete